jgi:hypothetical protein
MGLDAAVSKGPVTTEGGKLQAGFLVYIDNTKDFAFFTLSPTGLAQFERVACKEEKKDLKSAFYGDDKYICVPTKIAQDECLLFYHR